MTDNRESTMQNAWSETHRRTPVTPSAAGPNSEAAAVATACARDGEPETDALRAADGRIRHAGYDVCDELVRVHHVCHAVSGWCRRVVGGDGASLAPLARLTPLADGAPSGPTPVLTSAASVGLSNTMALSHVASSTVHWQDSAARRPSPCQAARAPAADEDQH